MAKSIHCGVSTLSLTTNAAGRAAVAGLTPTGAGSVQINVAAAFQGQTATATITQTNFVTAAQASASGASSGAGSGGGSAGGIGAGKVVAIGAGVAAEWAKLPNRSPGVGEHDTGNLPRGPRVESRLCHSKTFAVPH